DIPEHRLDLNKPDDPIAAIMAAPEFGGTVAFFADNPAAARSLVPADAQALLYTVIRNLIPEHVFEIGTFKAGTSEAICRALHANGRGTLHTVDPFRPQYIATILRHWPPRLLRHLHVHPTHSMAFYKDMESRGIEPDLVFVDGNHDYEFALFDITRGARYLKRAGFIFVDNIAQPGPFFAARDFLAANPGWREHGCSTAGPKQAKAFDRARTTIKNTDFMVLRAPQAYIVGKQPCNFGRSRWWSSRITGLRLELAGKSGSGTLHVQLVFRGFGNVPVEMIGEGA